MTVHKKAGTNIVKKLSRPRQSKYLLRLYISRSTMKSRIALGNIERVCEEHLKGRYDLEVIDIHDQANLARDEQIVAVPTLIKRLPPPLQRLVDFLKTKEITAVFTSLTLAGGSLEANEADVSSLMDTWLLLKTIEVGGERNRAIYVLKSRGMEHSN